MSLIAQVQLRLTQDLLAKLTNPDSQTTNTVNTAYLQIVCDDVQFGEFESFMNEAYDVTEQSRWHLLLATLLVKLKLIEYGAAADVSAENLTKRIEKLAETYRKIHARDRVAPQSSSPLQPTPEQQSAGGVPPVPLFDDPNFADLIPDPGVNPPDNVTGMPLP